MKKRMIIALVLGVILLVFGMLVGFSKKNKQVVVAEPMHYDSVDVDAPLFALTDTKEEAEKIAEFYDIEFIGFSDGVATYYTDKDLPEIVEKSNEDDNPRLYLNYKRNITDTNVHKKEEN